MPVKAPIAPHGVEDSVVSVQSGTDWLVLPGTRGWTIDGGAREGRSVGAEGSDGAGLVGNKPAPQITIPALGLAAHGSWDVVEGAFDSGDPLNFRLEYAEMELRAVSGGSDTAAITASTGAVTWGSGAPPRSYLREGAALRIGTGNGAADYFIETVAAPSGATTVLPRPAADVSAAVYSLRIPALRLEFQAKVMEVPTILGDAPEGGELNGSLRLQATAPLPSSWDILAPAP